MLCLQLHPQTQPSTRQFSSAGKWSSWPPYQPTCVRGSSQAGCHSNRVITTDYGREAAVGGGQLAAVGSLLGRGGGGEALGSGYTVERHARLAVGPGDA